MVPEPKVCNEKEQLLEKFLAAVSEQFELQSAQRTALLNGQGFVFEDELRVTLDRRENAKSAVIAHCEKHGC